MRQRQVWFDCS